MSNSFKGLENGLQRWVAKSRWRTLVALKLRNQAECVIGFYLGETADPARNGELQLVRVLAPAVSRFVDVGANVGAWTESVLQASGGRAVGYCFEPAPRCVDRLRERFRGANVQIREAAVSDTVGQASFSFDGECGETSSLNGGDFRAGTQSGMVEVTTLAREFGGTDEVIDFLKTDCEGWDLKVLEGAGLVLDRTRFVQFEYNANWIQAGGSLACALRLLRGKGFEVFLVRSSGLHPFNYERWGDFYRYSNFFACRASDRCIVEGLLGAEM